MAALPLVPPRTAVGDPNRPSRLVFCAGFVLFLAIALVAQLLALPWRAWLPGAEGERSLIAGVRSAVYSFMSYIP